MTAVIVGHDGAPWLAQCIDALLGQTRPAERIVAVDTGSRDRSGAVLTDKLGQAAVFGMDRTTGYAAAVRRALQHKTAAMPVGVAGPARGERGVRGSVPPGPTEWIWLLHDDCEPAADALEQLLRGAAQTPGTAVVGPKLMDWTDRNVIVEAGLGLDTVGRRISGVEPGEVDQGQHDGDRDALAVSSAGMLVRRDIWDLVGGFDPSMNLFGEDIDLCWRVQAAGYRVRVITDAVVFHAMAASRGRRAVSVGRRARLLQRRHALATLLGNLPARPMVGSLLANLTISLLRTVFYLVAKRGTAALDEAAAVAAVVGHPLRFAAARRRRARGRRAAYSRVRADLPSGRSVRRAAEYLMLVAARSGPAAHAAAGPAVADPAEDDLLLTDTGFLQRFITRPSVLLMVGFLIVAGVAERSLLGGGPLGGGALLPAWEGASTLWGEVLRAFHPSGVGSAGVAPPSAAFVAVLATILFGKVWLAVDVLLLGAVPLAGLTSLFALRRVTSSAWLRVWGAASYALLPVAFGAVAAGRLGSAVAFVLIPLIAALAGRMLTSPPRLARRAGWATGLVVTVATAFVPVLWPVSVAAAVIAAAAYRRSRAVLINLAIAVITPLLLLLPWMARELAHPSLLLLEAGVQQPGLAKPDLPARSLLLLSPGGPGLPPFWVSAAVVAAGLAALAARRRRALVVAGWSVALLGFCAALLASRQVVTLADGREMTPWPGPALAVAAAGLLLAAVAAADGLRPAPAERTRAGAGRRRGLRGAGIAAAVVVLSAPLLAAAYWLADGVTGPVTQAASQVVPAVVTPPGSAGRQLRTLVLSSVRGHVSYLLLRGTSPQFADAGLQPSAAAQAALGGAVAALVAPGGSLVSSQSRQLAAFDVGFVLLRPPLSPGLVSTLDDVPGLSPVSMTSSFDLWRLSVAPARVSVVEPGGAVVAIPSGPIGVAAAAPAAGGTVELAEPAGGWRATLDGHPLTPVRSPAGSWAQAFKLPPGGGTLTIQPVTLAHDLVTVVLALAFCVVALLALPGARTGAELQAAVGPQAAAEPPDQPDHGPGADDGGQPRKTRPPGLAARGAVRGGAVRGAAAAGGAAAGGAAAGGAAAGGAAAARQAAPAPAGRRRRTWVLRPGWLARRAKSPGAAAGARNDAARPIVSPRTAWPDGRPASRFLAGPDVPGRAWPAARSPSGGQDWDRQERAARPGSRPAPVRGEAAARPPEPAEPGSRRPGRRPAPGGDWPAPRRAGPPASEWPETSRQRGWPRRPGDPAARGGAPRRGPSGQAPRPEPGESLEALPAEVHHDWPERDARRQAWLPPEDETSGETW